MRTTIHEFKVLTIDLRLPDRVGHAPEGGQDVEEVGLVRVRRPREEHNDDGGVDEHAKDEDGHSPHVLDDKAEAEGAQRVGGPVRHQDEAHVLHAVRAGDVALELKFAIQVSKAYGETTRF